MVAVQAALAIGGAIAGHRAKKKAKRAARKAAKLQALAQEEALRAEQEAARKNLFFAKLSARSTIVGGRLADLASRAEAAFGEAEAAIAQQDIIREADRIREENKRFTVSQKMAFIKSGVDLSGSAILVLEDSRIQGEKVVDSIVSAGERGRGLADIRSANLRRTGRARLIGAEIQADAEIFNATSIHESSLIKKSGAATTLRLGRLNAQNISANANANIFSGLSSAAASGAFNFKK